MRLASKGGIDWREREAFRWFRLRKRIYQRLAFKPGQAKTIVFIVGCQRSGTSMLSHLFRLDRKAITYDEMSPLSVRDPERLRLNPLSDVISRVAADRAPLVVLKPLVESQNLARLLAEFPQSRAVWMYRDYRDVAVSNLRFFGEDNSRQDLLPILNDEQENWRAENLSHEVIGTIKDIYDPTADPHDAAALFWYARNSLLFVDDLVDDSRITLCNYDQLVTNSTVEMARLYDALGLAWPPPPYSDDVHPHFRGQGQKLVISSRVQDLCQEMLATLNTRAGL